MGRRQEVYVVKLTDETEPDPRALERGLQMWAAFLTENRRRKSRAVQKKAPSDEVG